MKVKQEILASGILSLASSNKTQEKRSGYPERF